MNIAGATIHELALACGIDDRRTGITGHGRLKFDAVAAECGLHAVVVDCFHRLTA